MKYLSDKALEAYAWLQVPRKKGVTAIEYGLMAALIAIVIIAAVTLLGKNLSSVFNTLASKVKG